MEDFEKFLKWLDPDRDNAGIKYEEIRRKLTRFFLLRGCGVEAETIADQTIVRVIRKVPELTDTYEGEPIRYFFGVARNVFKERLGEQLRIRSLRRAYTNESSEESEEKERLDRCLQKCMDELSIFDQQLIIKYYVGDKSQKIANRRDLAEQLGLAVNAMRIRAHRIRTRLSSCFEAC